MRFYTISGGLDSSVIAALCQEKYTGVPLIGISIPMSSTNEHKEQAKRIGKKYCSAFEQFDEWEEKYFDTDEDEIQDVINTVSLTDRIANKAEFEIKSFPKKILNGNIKARLRMITLYDLARKTNGIVLSTDNLSEFNMGFWTINGDVGDYGPIQNIWKGLELPTIAKLLNIPTDIIKQKPSDGLMVTEDNTDEAQLGAPYKHVDAIMIVFLNKKDYKKEWKKIKEDKIVIDIVNRYKNTKFKRDGTTNITRKQLGIK